MVQDFYPLQKQYQKNRFESILEDVKDKVYTHDIFNSDSQSYKMAKLKVLNQDITIVKNDYRNWLRNRNTITLMQLYQWVIELLSLANGQITLMFNDKFLMRGQKHETRESKYWIDLLVKTYYLNINDEHTKSLLNDIEEIRKLLTSIVKSIQGNKQMKQLKIKHLKLKYGSKV